MAELCMLLLACHKLVKNEQELEEVKSELMLVKENEEKLREVLGDFISSTALQDEDRAILMRLIIELLEKKKSLEQENQALKQKDNERNLKLESLQTENKKLTEKNFELCTIVQTLEEKSGGIYIPQKIESLEKKIEIFQHEINKFQNHVEKLIEVTTNTDGTVKLHEKISELYEEKLAMLEKIAELELVIEGKKEFKDPSYKEICEEKRKLNDEYITAMHDLAESFRESKYFITECGEAHKAIIERINKYAELFKEDIALIEQARKNEIADIKRYAEIYKKNQELTEKNSELAKTIEGLLEITQS